MNGIAPPGSAGAMVRNHLEARGIRDPRTLAAFARIPREKFVPLEASASAYDDRPLPIGHGQTISQPYMAALMTELLRLRGGEKVLEIGTGSGYQTAVLAELGAEVFTIERIVELAESARLRIESMGWTSVKFRVGNGAEGWPEEAPFDRILVTAAAPTLPAVLASQLKDDGLLLLPVGLEDKQELLQVRRTPDGFETKRICSCVFVRLVGKEEA